MPKERLKYALASYLALAALAQFLLEGKIRIIVWIFLAALALKSWLATLKREP